MKEMKKYPVLKTMSKTVNEHKNSSSNDIKCSVITLSDSRKDLKDDLSGQYIASEISKRYTLESTNIIPDEELDLINLINEKVNKTDVILTTGGTGLTQRDITIECVEKLYDKKINGFGEIFRQISYKEIGAAAILSRASAGIYKKTLIFSMPGSINAVKTALKIIIDELPHFVHHATK